MDTMYLRNVRALAVSLALLAFSPAAQGSVMLSVHPDDFFGVRSTAVDGQIVASGAWADGFQVTWNITTPENATFPWTYEYVFSGITEVSAETYQPDVWNPILGQGGGLSHAILSLTVGARLSDLIDLTVFAWDDGAWHSIEFDTTFGWQKVDQGQSNPGLPLELYGVKFENMDFPDSDRLLYLSFTSYREPVWGSFYAKGGQDPESNEVNWAYNAGLGTTDNPGSVYAHSDDPRELQGYVAVPNGVVPEPASIVIWSLIGLGGAAAYRLRRRRRAAAAPAGRWSPESRAAILEIVGAPARGSDV